MQYGRLPDGMNPMSGKVLITPTRKTIRKTPVGGLLSVSRRDARVLVRLKLADLVDAKPEADAPPVMSDPSIDPDPGPGSEPPEEQEEKKAPKRAPKKSAEKEKRTYKRRDMEAED